MNRVTIATLLTVAPFAFAQAAEHKVTQKDRKFDKQHIEIKVGDTVHFENQDDFFHNVYSLSDSNFFDLKSYPKGESRANTFNKPGVVNVECAIHPDMKMVVEVKE